MLSTVLGGEEEEEAQTALQGLNNRIKPFVEIDKYIKKEENKLKEMQELCSLPTEKDRQLYLLNKSKTQLQSDKKEFDAKSPKRRKQNG